MKNFIAILLCSSLSLSAFAEEADVFAQPKTESAQKNDFFSVPAIEAFFSSPTEVGTTSPETSVNPTPKQQDEEIANAVFQLTSVPKLQSAIALIYDEQSHRPLYTKNAENIAPIASITKLMTAMVILDAKLPMDENITICNDDADHRKGTHSRMRSGLTLTRGELLKLALMASENRAAAALARTYPGGMDAAVARMNAKAQELGMRSTRFFDPTGLNSNNVSTAQDLVLMVRAAQYYEPIHRFTTSSSHIVQLAKHRPLRYGNTNPLVKNASWDIGVSKTGYINEAGRCLVMKATISKRPVIIVLLDSWGKRTRVADAIRIKKWMESASGPSIHSGRG
jgi:D-alanyl-D-alanine endopeptidase (penicillin-binding protein 7)